MSARVTDEAAVTVDAPCVRVELIGPVARVVIDRPHRRNAMGEQFSEDMQAAFDVVERSDVGAVVLTGAGSVFCAGGDVQEIMSVDSSDPVRDFHLIRGYNRVISRIRGLDQPVVAAVNGIAVGGGVALALACDLALAGASARYLFAFERIGLAAADMGCASMLARAVGPLRAAQLLLTSGEVAGPQGVDLGLFVSVHEDDELQSAALALAERLANGPRRANASTKLAIHRAAHVDLETALEYEAYVQTVRFADVEHKERLAQLRGARR